MQKVVVKTRRSKKISTTKQRRPKDKEQIVEALAVSAELAVAFLHPGLRVMLVTNLTAWEVMHQLHSPTMILKQTRIRIRILLHSESMTLALRFQLRATLDS